MLWLQGRNSAPDMVQACRKSWERLNPGWEVRALELTTLREALPAITASRILSANKEPEACSDQIRIELLYDHGGVWADATAMCARPLDEWLVDRMSSGFFAFDRPAPDRMIASWFLAASKGSYIIERWRDRVIDYWLNRSSRDDYFWFHRFFAAEYEADPKFRSLWDSTPKLPATHMCHFGPNDGRLYGRATPQYINALVAPPAPVFKLTHKLPQPREEGSLIELLCRFGRGDTPA